MKYKNLIFLTAFIFMFVFTGSVKADNYNSGVYSPRYLFPGDEPIVNNNSYQDYNYYQSQSDYQQSLYQSTLAYQKSTSQPTVVYQNQIKQPEPATIIASNVSSTKTKTVVAQPAQTITQPEVQNNTEVQTQNYNEGSNLKALTVSGYNGFMPDTIFEWILVVIFILVIIILSRQFKKKEHHEIGAVAHH
jgi:hypothetical protein